MRMLLRDVDISHDVDVEKVEWQKAKLLFWICFPLAIRSQTCSQEHANLFFPLGLFSSTSSSPFSLFCSSYLSRCTASSCFDRGLKSRVSRVDVWKEKEHFRELAEEVLNSSCGNFLFFHIC